MNAARELSKARKLYVKTCPICKEGFEGIKIKVFCSEKCKQKNKNEKKKQALRGEHFKGIE